MSLQCPEPKILGKREENGVSTPHALSIRPYAHIISKHAKEGHLLETCHFTSLKTSYIIKKFI